MRMGKRYPQRCPCPRLQAAHPERVEAVPALVAGGVMIRLTKASSCSRSTNSIASIDTPPLLYTTKRGVYFQFLFFAPCNAQKQHHIRRRNASDTCTITRPR